MNDFELSQDGTHVIEKTLTPIADFKQTLEDKMSNLLLNRETTQGQLTAINDSIADVQASLDRLPA